MMGSMNDFKDDGLVELVQQHKKQGNKRKRFSFSNSKYQCKATTTTTTISLLYIIFYYANFSNWTKSVIFVTAINKLDIINYRNENFTENLLFSVSLNTTEASEKMFAQHQQQRQINDKTFESDADNSQHLASKTLTNCKKITRSLNNTLAYANGSLLGNYKTIKRKLKFVLGANIKQNTGNCTKIKMKYLPKWKIRKKNWPNKKRLIVKRNVPSINQTLDGINLINLNKTQTITVFNNSISEIDLSNEKRSPLTEVQFSAAAQNSLNSTNVFKKTNHFEMATKLKYNKLAKNKILPSEYRQGKVSLLGLFELSTRYGIRPEGRSELAAAQMAVQHINKKQILPGYTLELLTNDTKCDPGVGVDRFFHALYTQHSTRMIMLLGSACSEVTESLAKVVPYWNIVQVSFGSTSPALSDRREFPLFYRTVAPDSSHNPARIAFIRRFGWDTVTTFSQNEEIHSLAVNDLVTELESANISCAATITFAETDFKDQLRMLRDLDTRIIIGSFSQELAPKIFCEAYKLGMYGADYAWILHETIGPPWWKKSTHECSQYEMTEASQNVLLVSSHNSIVGNAISFSGLTNKMFVDELRSLKIPKPVSRYAPQTYDAVWAIALALKGAEEQWRRNASTSKLDNFDYTRYDMTFEFLKQFNRLKFLGVSGPVSFSGADRIGTSIFYQIQYGHLQPVALFHPSELHLDFNCPECVLIKWQGGQVPIAKRIFKLRVDTIAPFAFYTITSIASVGITLSIAFLAFNLHFRKLKSIKLSSPKLSNITAVGCILVYAAVVLLGLDYSTLPANDKAFSTICTARVYLLSSGFSLAFGSMFAKTYRVHRIFTHSGGGVCKDKMLRDTQLISLVCALLLLDGLVVTLWVVADPMERHLSNLTLEISLTDRSVVYQPQVEVCRSNHTQSWLGALYAYKGLLLIVGVYMAWETRHVKIPALNDSKYIGISVYSVVITSAIVVVLANLIADRVTLAFITITALILTSTTATLSLLFLPKMHDIWGKAGIINDPVIHSMGLKMECNTRRFVTDDRRELQYRVEVQNRVYKKEMAALDAEITKLQKMLESNSSTSSSDLSILQSIKHDIIIVNESAGKSAQKKVSDSRTPSIGGGLPLLLLSVLPPVIPRASWPSAENTMITPMRHSVQFSSQPQLDNEGRKSGIARLPAIDLFNLRLTHQQATADARTGILDRIKGIFVSGRKDSTISYTEASIALKRHMGRITDLVSCQTTLSCNALNTSTKMLHKTSLAKSGTEINTIYPSSGELNLTSGIGDENSRRIVPFCTLNDTSYCTELDEIQHIIDVPDEPHVVFQLPKNRRPSTCQPNVQPTLRERVKGSPRFPHRIAPTCSLDTLKDDVEADYYNNDSICEQLKKLKQYTNTKTKWKSMEESSFISTSANNSSIATAATVHQLKHSIQFLPISVTEKGNLRKSDLNDLSDDDDDVFD